MWCGRFCDQVLCGKKEILAALLGDKITLERLDNLGIGVWVVVSACSTCMVVSIPVKFLVPYKHCPRFNVVIVHCFLSDSLARTLRVAIFPAGTGENFNLSSDGIEPWIHCLLVMCEFLFRIGWLCVANVTLLWWCYNDLGFALVWRVWWVTCIVFYCLLFVWAAWTMGVPPTLHNGVLCHFVIRSEYRVITRLKNLSFALKKKNSFWSQVRSLLLDSFCPIFCFFVIIFVFTFLPMRLISFSSLIGSTNFPVKMVTKYHLRTPVWSAVHFVEMTRAQER